MKYIYIYIHCNNDGNNIVKLLLLPLDELFANEMILP